MVKKKPAEEVKVEVAKETISPLPTDLGRADLNQIAHKINEIISRIS